MKAFTKQILKGCVNIALFCAAIVALMLAACGPAILVDAYGWGWYFLYTPHVIALVYSMGDA